MCDRYDTDEAIHFRDACREDLARMIQMLSDDPLGGERECFESPLSQSYVEAFEAISNDPNNQLVSAVCHQQLVGFLQITFIPNLTYQGRSRAMIEGVRIDKSMRHKGIGRKLIRYAISQAQQRGCHLIQLTTDKKRLEALAFYQSLGFSASHVGLKLHLD